MNSKTLRIAGMSCERCAKVVESALGALTGADVQACRERGTVRVKAPEGSRPPRSRAALGGDDREAALVRAMEGLLALLRALDESEPRGGSATASPEDVKALIAYFESMGECRNERQFLDKAFARFVDERVAAELLARGLQPQVREATILYSDIEGFTTLSERLEPERVIALLNEYFTVVAQPIREQGGVITQFQGDAMLVSFNLPMADPAHATHAVRAAVGMQALLEGRRFGEGLALKTRIGINTGLCVGGAVGTEDRLSYTVHGDEVNVAARLQELNKHYDSRILVSERTAKLAGADFQFERVGEVPIRGRESPVTLYRVAKV